MKARIEKVNAYYNEDIMLIAPEEEMANFASYMAVIIQEAEKKVYKDGLINTAKHYGKIAEQFRKIYNNIKEEE